jgi:catechol 2,3-dioxygenase-like lactoylglutathione lyase family enzyme
MRAHPIRGIDHLLIVASDLDRAAATYRRLGFTLSRRAVHSAHMGTANHTIMLEHDYFELLAVLTPTQANTRWRQALAEGEGLAGFAAATPSAAVAGGAWREAGFAASDILAFSRAVERADGKRLEARFEVVTLPAQTVPAMSLFACAQLTRDAVWLPELLHHPNTARAIRKLSIAAPDPLRAAESWLRALPGSTCASASGGAQIRIGRHALEFLEPVTAARRYGLAKTVERARAFAIEFEVTDVDACREALLRGGLSPRLQGELTWVGSDEAHGVVISFLPAGAPLVWCDVNPL